MAQLLSLQDPASPRELLLEVSLAVSALSGILIGRDVRREEGADKAVHKVGMDQNDNCGCVSVDDGKLRVEHKPGNIAALALTSLYHTKQSL